MAQITRQVEESSDDCFRRLTSTAWDLTSAYDLVGAYSATLYQYGSGLRFTNITIPQGATIDEAYLTFRCSLARDTANCNSRISAEDVDDAVTFADDSAAFDARWAARTTARVDWDAIPAWTKDTDYNSPEIKAVIQEIVDREHWVSGNSIAIFWDDFEDRSIHVENRRIPYSQEGSAEFAPKLIITYTPPPPVPVADGDLIGIAIIKRS